MKKADFRLLRQLTLLEAVAEEGSLSKAAKRLSLTPPALTEQIGFLEAELGAELLHRTSRGAVPTDLARSLLPQIRAFSEAAVRLQREARHAALNGGAAVRVGAVFELMLSFIPAVIEKMKRKSPDLQIRVSDLDSSRAEEQLLSGDLDIAVGRFGAFEDSRIGVQELFSEKLILAVPASHRLSGKDSVSLEECRGDVWIGISPAVSRAYQRRISVWLNEEGLEPFFAQEADSITEQIGLIGCGEGVAAVPESFRAIFPPGVKALEIRGRVPSVRISAAWRKDRLSSAADALLCCMKAI